MAKGGTKVYIINGKVKDNLYKSITKSNLKTGTEISFWFLVNNRGLIFD